VNTPLVTPPTSAGGPSGHPGPPRLARAGGPLTPPLQARRRGKVASVATTVTIDEPAQLRLTATPLKGGKPLPLLKGSRLGPTVTRADGTAIAAAPTRAQALRLALQLPAGLLQRGNVYLIRLAATDPDGERSTLLIRFRG